MLQWFYRIGARPATDFGLLYEDYSLIFGINIKCDKSQRIKPLYIQLNKNMKKQVPQKQVKRICLRHTSDKDIWGCKTRRYILW